MTLLFSINTSKAQEIKRHLVACDETFHPPLSSKVDLAEYSKKLADCATRFEAWSDGELVGLVSAYCDNVESGSAYVTNVSVLPAFTGRGIARRLLSSCRDHASGKGFVSLSLEVDPKAQSALYLYHGLGFQFEDLDSTKVGRMALKLTEAVTKK